MAQLGFAWSARARQPPSRFDDDRLVPDDEKADEWWHQAEAGGGVLLDYSCYGACLAAWLLPEQPISVRCLKANLRSRYGDAEDNAAMLVRFPSSMAVLEASWTTFHNGVANGPILYGSDGTIVVDFDDILVYRDRGSRAPTVVEKGSPLPQGRSNIAEEFLHRLDTGEPMHPTLETPLNLATMAILERRIHRRRPALRRRSNRRRQRQERRSDSHRRRGHRMRRYRTRPLFPGDRQGA